jgi:hypothetical protein
MPSAIVTTHFLLFTSGHIIIGSELKNRPLY